jgi:hypothetical protein
MLQELYRQLRDWLFAKEQRKDPAADQRDRSSMSDLARLLQESDPPGPLRG